MQLLGLGDYWLEILLSSRQTARQSGPACGEHLCGMFARRPVYRTSRDARARVVGRVCGLNPFFLAAFCRAAVGRPEWPLGRVGADHKAAFFPSLPFLAASGRAGVGRPEWPLGAA